jgi:hypothetical protein
LKDREETDALAAFDVGTLNEVMTVFGQFIKSAKRKSLSYSDIFPMLRKLMANVGSLRANRHAETLIKAVSQRFSQA